MSWFLYGFVVLIGILFGVPVKADPYLPLDHGVAVALKDVPAGGRVVMYRGGKRWATVTVVSADASCKTFSHSLFPGVYRGCMISGRDTVWRLYEGSVAYASFDMKVLREGGRCREVSLYIMPPNPLNLPAERVCEEGHRSYTIYMIK